MIVLYYNKTRDEVDRIIYSIIKLTVSVRVTVIRRIKGGADPIFFSGKLGVLVNGMPFCNFIKQN